MRHACVPPRCGRMRVPEGLERGAGITRICSDADGPPEEATGATLWQRFPWDASRSISHVAEMPQPPGDRQPCLERRCFKNGSFGAAQAPELRPGLHPLVLTRSVIVGLPLAARRSGQAAVAGQSGPGRVGVGPRGHSVAVGVTGRSGPGRWQPPSQAY